MIVLPLISVKISVVLLIGPETDQSASGLSQAARHIEIQSGRLKEGETLRPQSLSLRNGSLNLQFDMLTLHVAVIEQKIANHFIHGGVNEPFV